jgi:sialidase-1
VPGRIGTARVLSGTGSFVQIPNATTLNVGKGQDFSLAVWIKRGRTTASSFVLAKGAGTTGDVGFSIVMGGSTAPTAELSKPGESSRLIVSGPPITDTNWHLLVVTASRAGSITLYVDGVAVASVPIGAYNVDLTNSKPLAIGAYTNGIEGFAGAIDDVRVYRVALTAQQVTQLENP